PVVAVGELPLGGLTPCHGGLVGLLSHRESLARLLELIGVEHRGEPAVDGASDSVLPQVDGARVLEALRRRVLLGERAPIVLAAVVDRPLRPPLAYGARDQAGQLVGPAGRAALHGRRAAPAGPTDLLSPGEELGVHEGLMDDPSGPEPVGAVVPAHLGLVAQG